MTSAQIQRAQATAQIPFAAALQIREILEAARKDYGPKRYDEDGIESQIISLVTDEDE